MSLFDETQLLVSSLNFLPWKKNLKGWLLFVCFPFVSQGLVILQGDSLFPRLKGIISVKLGFVYKYTVHLICILIATLVLTERLLAEDIVAV